MSDVNKGLEMNSLHFGSDLADTRLRINTNIRM